MGSIFFGLLGWDQGSKSMTHTQPGRPKPENSKNPKTPHYEP